MTKNTSITIGPYFDAFIQAQINTGRYATTSEVVRAALRLLEEEERKTEAIRKALESGEASGIAENFDSKEFMAKVRKKYEPIT